MTRSMVLTPRLPPVEWLVDCQTCTSVSALPLIDRGWIIYVICTSSVIVLLNASSPRYAAHPALEARRPLEIGQVCSNT
jgi:hypothetical protein